MKLKHLLTFLHRIESMPLQYMITGSIASILYGRPRLTQDMDVVLALSPKDAKDFSERFDLQEFYCPPLEIIQEELARKNGGHFNIIDQRTGYKIDIYPAADDPLCRWGLEHRRRVELIPGEEVWVAPPEYVIVMKLLYYKEGGSQKHLEDIRAMLEVSGEEIERAAIEEWGRKKGIEKEWKEIETLMA